MVVAVTSLLPENKESIKCNIGKEINTITDETMKYVNDGSMNILYNHCQI